MKDTFFKAKLIAWNRIRVVLFTSSLMDEDMRFWIVKDFHEVINLKLEKRTSLSGVSYFELSLKNDLELGHFYNVHITQFGSDALDVSEALDFEDFDEKFHYDGDDLGAIYHENYTTFRVYAPLANSLFLKYRRKDEKEWSFQLMNRDVGGTYFTRLEGNQDELIYRYIVTNNGVVNETIDPYAFSSLANEDSSVVVNMNKYIPNFHDDKLPPCPHYTDAIIYEAHVRDLTSSKMTDIVHKGKFKGLIEKGRKTLGGHPAGFDYLINLGFTHLQLQPIQDYKTVDELETDRLYNWGYDPRQYFALEGSFASDSNDAYARVNEFKDVVSAFHQSGIRINIDVVYNHMFEESSTSLEKLVPNYYFRRYTNGKLANGSGCGNDFNSKRIMARKLILDSIKFLIKYYHIDGLRFDLMGLIDIETMNMIVKMTKELKTDFMIYGEGWNMMTALKDEERAHHDNASMMPDIAFFNDAFRNIVGGGIGYDLRRRGYALGEESYREGFKYAYLGSTLDYTYTKRFLSANQSLNYVECHDNECFYDKLVACLKEEDEDENHYLDRIKMTNAIIALSFGVPFYHMGQEIGQTKRGNGNTYNAGDKFNRLDYKLVDERWEMINHFVSINYLRKFISELRTFDPNIIEKMVEFEDFPNGALIVDYGNHIPQFTSFKVFINPSDETIFHELDDYHQVLLSTSGYVKKSDIHMKHIMITPRSCTVLVRYK